MFHPSRGTATLLASAILSAGLAACGGADAGVDIVAAGEALTESAQAVDTKAPTVAISTPTTASTFTSANPTIAMSGTASDNYGVTSVVWSNGAGASGAAILARTGRSATWSVPSAALVAGINTITVRARDKAGNASTATLEVSYNVPVVPSTTTYDLGVAVSGSGSVGLTPAGTVCSANCTYSYTSGTGVTLTATPATGYTFSGWGGACAGTTPSCTVTMTNAGSVTASFVQTTYALTVANSGNGTVTSTTGTINCGTACADSLVAGTNVTLTATPAAGYAVTWSGACTGTSNSCAVAMTQARNVTATFASTATATTTTTASTACSSFYGADFALNSTRTVATVGTNAKPAKGVAVADPAYKTCIVRVTDHAAEAPVDFARNDYSRRQAFNADSSLQLIYALDGYWHLYRADNNQYVRKLSGPAADAEPQWHPTNPNLLYYLPTYGIGLKMYELNVSTGAVRTVADFGARLKARWPGAAAAWTRSEGSPSADGRYWCYMVDNSAWGSVGVFTYDLQQDQILGYYDTNGDRPDHVSMSPSGKYCVVSGDSTVGTTAFTKDFSSSVKLHHKSEHSDLALTAAGEDVYVAVDYEASQGEVFMVNMNTGVRTLLFPTYVNGTTTALHVSGKAFSKPGWAVVSTYSRTGTQQWLHEKVMAVQLAANPTVYSLAYHRSLYNQYWTAPVASVNRDFTKVTYNSNWGVNSTTNVDAYRIELPAGALK